MIDNAAIFIQSGHNIASERVSSINDNTMRSHFHSYFELFYLEKGKRAVVAGERSYLLGPHEFIIFPPYTMHHSFSEPDVAFARIVLYFAPDTIPEALELRLRQETKPHAIASTQQQQDFYNQLCALMAEQDPQNKEAFQDEALHSRLNLLLISALRHESKDVAPQSEPKIAKIVQYVHNHYFQELSLDDLAEMFFINKFSLCREFKRFTMCSFVEYLNKIRVLHAQRLFVETPCAALWSISTRSAYSTPSAYLSKATRALPRSRLMSVSVVSPTLNVSLLSTPIRPQRRCASKCDSSATNHHPSNALKARRQYARTSESYRTHVQPQTNL